MRRLEDTQMTAPLMARLKYFKGKNLISTQQARLTLKIDRPEELRKCKVGTKRFLMITTFLRKI
jgi:hypothetical protein